MFQQRIMNGLYKLWSFVWDEMDFVVFQEVVIASVEAYHYDYNGPAMGKV